MPCVVLLWLALLQALSPAPSVRLPDGGAARARVHAEPAGTTHDAFRGARPVAEAALARATAPAPVGGGGSTPALAASASPALAAASARQALRRHGRGTHAVAARGGLLPYFPTAPPLQG